MSERLNGHTLSENNELVVDGRGTTRRVKSIENIRVFDKKQVIVDETSMLNTLAEMRRIGKEQEVGQREATIELNPRYPDLPYFIWMHNDPHLGSIHTDYDTYRRDFDIVDNNPNFGMASNGDEIDHFSLLAGKAATGMYEDPFSPQQQALLLQNLFRRLDNQGKLLVASFGNHNNWLKSSGYNFEETVLRDFHCPIFNCGGLLKIRYGSQEYKMAISHMHWGNSKLNPTNACKRMLEHDFPEADILYLGHTHMKEVLRFNRSNQEKIAIIGGTYKVDDTFGGTHGLGSVRGNLGGITLAIYPHEKKIIPLYSVAEAKEMFDLYVHTKDPQRRINK